MGFEDICGQEQIINSIKLAMSHSTVAHAYLFCGPTGSGKKKLAKAFAMALNCQNFPDGPCLICHSCRKAANGNHPDVHLVLPEVRTLKIDQIRQIKKTAASRPYEGRYQVFILDAAAAITSEAANSLLKVLEEPAASVVFIVLAINPAALPQTIVSRCRIINLARLSHSEMMTVLDRSAGLNAKTREMAVRLAEGIPGRALEVSGEKWRENLKEAAATLTAFGENGWISILAGQIAKKEDLDIFLDVLLTLLRDLLVLQAFGDSKNILCQEMAEELHSLTGYWNINSTRQVLETVLALQENLRTPVNVRLAVEQSLRCIKEVTRCRG